MSELPQPAATKALLWDVDNVAPRYRQIPSLAVALTELTGTGALHVAAAQRATFRSCRSLLAECGLEVLSGGRRRNGADRALVQRARLLHRQGVGCFLVASNDGRFAQIASFGELRVVTLDVDRVSARLLAAATEVTLLVPDGDQWQCQRVLPR